MYKQFQVAELNPVQLQGLLQGAIAPRPICFASTIDAAGNPNLSPFSFFNIFGNNPPVVVFSPARRVRDNTTKHTLENVMEVPEVCINTVTYDMVWQTSLASTEYDKGVDEFEKAGFGKEPSVCIKPWRVKQSPVQLECRVLEIKPVGTGGGAANLVLCEVVHLHVKEELLMPDGLRIDQQKINLVARLGGDWYCQTNGALFEIEKPIKTKGMGVDAMPDQIRLSPYLSGNHLGMLGNVEALPGTDEIKSVSPAIAALAQAEKHRMAAQLLQNHRVHEAWKVLLS